MDPMPRTARTEPMTQISALVPTALLNAAAKIVKGNGMTDPKITQVVEAAMKFLVAEKSDAKKPKR